MTRPRYDLELRKTVDVQADRLVFTLTVVNHGPGNARGGVVHDCLPNGLVFRDRGNAGRSDPYDPSVCEWPVGEVAAGETRSIEIHTTRPTGDFLNEAALVAGLDRDTNPANDTVSLIAVVP